ncbi:Yip1-domain-containing protein [Pluteus cervinus]|uniref:Yip1-domain-containing protein n=1 Tax=Pluteus cervinus TaxID=181527 RepID=A0ACD3BBX5_9AGAR|nr:Yip1-domain-containing protein [Pluteus cervinus]
MAYVSVEADERLEEGPEGLQFKSFSNNAPNNNTGGSGPGYLYDGPRRPSSGFWTLEYYQQYFDVDTITVVERCYGTLNVMAPDFIGAHLSPLDLYGPFWTLTTLIFTLFLSSSLAASISAYLSAPGQEYDYDFRLLSIAVSLVYAWGIGVPVLFWLGLRYIGLGEWGVLEAVALWGYGQFVWIPVSILCVIPVSLLRWLLVLVAASVSGVFLVRNVNNTLRAAEAKTTPLILAFIVAINLGIALTFKIIFFSYYVVENIGPDIPIPGGTDPSSNSTKLFFY